MNTTQQIVIIGGGFAGLQIAKRLNNSPYKVILIDKQNHHQFQPLFYQVATAGLEPSSISFPFRKIFQNSKNIEIRMAKVIHILTEKNTIVTSTGKISYDFLVIATGCSTNYFGNEHLYQHALPMKSTQEAIAIRNKLLMTFENIYSFSEGDEDELLNIVIVGGGPTGVELSGAFAEMKKFILPKDYPNIDFSKLNIILIEGSKSTLNNMSETSKKVSKYYLEKLGVKVRTELFVKDYDGKTITLSNGDTMKSRNVIWAAGVTGNIISGMTKSSVLRNRYIVDRYNKVQGYDNIFAIGDIAIMKTPLYPDGHPQVANVAINQGKNLASNLLKKLRNQSPVEYEYQDLGSMATIGRHKAVVDLPYIRLRGTLAWYIWMFLHLMLILGIRNKVIIFLNWAWKYVTKDSSLRLILEQVH